MKILFVTNEVPYPPDNGVRIVSHHAMRLMHRAGHQLALAVLTGDCGHAEKYFIHAQEFCQEEMAFWLPVRHRNKYSLALTAGCKHTLTFIERYSSDRFRVKLRQLINRFKPDVMHFDLISMTQYEDLAPPEVGTVASINDSLALALENALATTRYGVFERIYRAYELMRVRGYECTEYQRFNTIHVVSEHDRRYLLQMNPNIHPTAISNGVDASLFEIAGLTYGKRDILFLGQIVGSNLFYVEQFLEHSWPLIRKEVPDARFHIVGKGGLENTRLCAQAELLGGVTVRGYIEKLTDAYSGCGIAVVPIDKSCGILNKAIEAMAAGLVAVGFESSFAGIPESKDRIHHIAADGYHGMAQRIIEISHNAEKRCAIQRAAHRMASEHYSWDTRLTAMEQMYISAAKASRTQAEKASITTNPAHSAH